MFSASKTAAPVSGSFQVSNSLRFRSSASAYLNRTPSVAGNRTTWTWSGWVKAYGNQNGTLFAARTAVGANYTILSFAAANGGVIRLVDSTTTYPTVEWTRIFRDPSAWYHIVFVCDTTQATAANRAKLYVNGEAVTTTTSLNAVTQNANLTVNSTDTHLIGQQASGSYLDGYMAEINFIDGQALTPSSFGSINATTGVWQPARYTGSYGTNGFYLKFNNGTSTTTLGNDSSGNGNNWTTNNISLTAGSTYDWMIDSPTSYAGSSYGVGNYAVLNPLANSSTLVDANLRTNGGDKWSISTIGMTSGKWYCEVAVIAVGAESSVGISSQPYSGSSPVVGGTATSWGYYSNNGNKFNNTSGPGVAYGSSYTTSDVIGIAFDADAGTLTFYKNNVSQGTAYTGLTSGPYYFAVEGRTASSANNCAANFGQRPFAYTPPTGFKSLCTQNLPAPTIYNGANHMAATLYTGNGSTQSISNSVNSASFQPDLVWIKKRDTSGQDHVLQDSVRGFLSSTKLSSSSTAAENNTGGGVTDPQWGYVSSVSSSGINITVGSGTGDQVNKISGTYVGWQWKAGGTAVSNTTGSITSQVSANTTAGFSVVTYTGSGANSTIGHGLGIAPSMIITKNRSSGAFNWGVYHVAAGNTVYGKLNTTDAFTALAIWQNTTPTSSVFYVGNYNAANQGSDNYVAYCFAAIAGYSAFGSFTGNGSSDGPFTYTGFRPRYLLIKNSSATSQWRVADTSRSPYNLSIYSLRANDLTAENSTNCDIDILSNGFKIRGTGTDQNDSGNVYIYAAFAENPFQNSLAR